MGVNYGDGRSPFSSSGLGNPLRSIKSFGIQLEGCDVGSLMEFPLVIVDPEQCSKDDLAILHKHGCKVFAYVSLGEAEGYRSYFKHMDKKLIVHENPQWEDNWFVEYWKQEWHNVIVGHARKVLAGGYDGLFLDKLDAWGDHPDEDEVKCQKRMANLIKVLGENLPDTLFIGNAPGEVTQFLDPGDLHAILKEELFFENGKPRSDEQIREDLEPYKKYPVLLIEYVLATPKVTRASELARGYGYPVFFGDPDQNLNYVPHQPKG